MKNLNAEVNPQKELEEILRKSFLCRGKPSVCPIPVKLRVFTTKLPMKRYTTSDENWTVEIYLNPTKPLSTGHYVGMEYIPSAALPFLFSGEARSTQRNLTQRDKGAEAQRKISKSISAGNHYK